MTFSIDGVGGYDELQNSSDMRAFGIVVSVADLADIVASKRTVAREKDLQALPALQRLLAQKDRTT